MRAVVQRVTEASVTVNGESVAAIGEGLLVLLGVAEGDDSEQADFLARKIAGLRVFEDGGGKMNLDVQARNGEVLAVSQFTLCADVRKGRRPSFTQAAAPGVAEPLYLRFCESVAAHGIRVAMGVFQAHMAVTLVNDGPVTIWLDTDELMPK